MSESEDDKIISLEYLDEIASSVMLERLDIISIEKYSGFKGADIKALLKRHTSPTFTIGVDRWVVKLSYKKGLVKIFVKDANVIVLRRRTTLFDNPIDIESLYRIIVVISTLDHIISQKENRNV